ncbi:hypothetical protein NQ315_009555 [Exocentrus adspersus]|uniref:Coiled-coil domain-containing protein 86 n=1 Tax=Exocentrus adspersus TaxID=1586481 RepID=A0AAV8WH05_9CUCU|nr:hypothetical protein NQ315_009555 [Exocentrus adspersus]
MPENKIRENTKLQISSKKNNLNKSSDKPEVIPKGKPKSGRFWKKEKTKFSSIIKTKGIRVSFEKKQALRQQLKHIKEASNAIKTAKEEEKQLRKERRRENLKRQEENRKKSEVVQVITNTKKLKKMRKKHLRTIEKRDTTVVSN